ncbi:MAG: DUF192 domain-containing protein [Spirochaetales bacterium]|nr:DUF192 domain-containing protein [Spirochaetales bacterium]
MNPVERKWRQFPLITGVLTVMLFFSSCSADELEIIKTKIGGETFTLEVARSEDERQTGLMNREYLEENHGMLFVFESDRRLSFWMKNTSIPLSIAYLSKDGRVLELHELTPFSLEPVQSKRSVRLAIELNQGRFKELGVEPGDTIDLPEHITE